MTAARFTCAGITMALAVVVLVFPGTSVAQVPQGIGFWNVQGRAVPGTRCADWSVRLAVEDGRPTGVLSVGQGNVTIQNLALRSDGSFSGTTPAGHVNNRSIRAYRISGRFTGDLARITVSNEICPDRSASARRQPFGY